MFSITSLTFSLTLQENHKPMGVEGAAIVWDHKSGDKRRVIICVGNSRIPRDIFPGLSAPSV